MSRELKFRCYDVEKKVIYPPSSIWKINLSAYEDNFNLKLMQFTGYLDKNDKEIYEGDILSTPYYGNVQVIFSQYSGGWLFHPVDRKAMCSPSDRVINDLIHLNYSKDVPEIIDYFNRDNNSAYFVIGNIYENPELMGCI